MNLPNVENEMKFGITMSNENEMKFGITMSNENEMVKNMIFQYFTFNFWRESP